MGTKVIASNGYFGIIECESDGPHMYIKTTRNSRKKRIRYTNKGEPYFIEYKIRYFVNEFFRTEGTV